MAAAALFDLTDLQGGCVKIYFPVRSLQSTTDAHPKELYPKDFRCKAINYERLVEIQMKSIKSLPNRAH